MNTLSVGVITCGPTDTMHTYVDCATKRAMLMKLYGRHKTRLVTEVMILVLIWIDLDNDGLNISTAVGVIL